MNKVVITADFHFGVPERLQDILWSARVIRQYCQQNDIDTVLVLGDLVHDRRAMEIDVWNALYDFLASTKQMGQTWYAFPGNHDMFLKHSWTINALRPLQDNMIVIDDVKLLTINERRFFVLPFIHFEQSYMRVLHQIEKLYQDDDTLLTHVGVRGATLNTCFLLKDWNHVTFDESPFRRVYAGHFHSQQSLNNQVFYPGSTIPFKLDEGNVPHGFYVLDIDTMKHEFVDIWDCGRVLIPDEVVPPQFYTILRTHIDDIDTETINNNIIRVVHDKDILIDERESIRDKLLQMGARSVRWLIIYDKEVAVPKANLRTTVSNPVELFSRWLVHDQTGTAGLSSKLLTKLNLECQSEGDERYVYDVQLE